MNHHLGTDAETSLPGVTVITPVYNGELYILQCLENVKSQRAGRVEHLIVDGGSRDRTIEIVRDYARSNGHVRWISEKDQGQSDAMNKGIALARYPVISFLNVDDYYEPGVIPRVQKLMVDSPEPAFLAGDCQVWNATNELIYTNRPRRLDLKSLAFQLSQFPVNPSAYFYHKSLHERIGLYDVNEHYAMDLDFLLRAVSRSNCQYVPEVWGNMRYQPGTKTYEDTLAGESFRRIKRVLAKYQREFGIWTRMRYQLLPDGWRATRGFLGGIKAKLIGKLFPNPQKSRKTKQDCPP